MTKKELSQLYYLNREIDSDKQRLEELRAAATSTTPNITGLPHVAGISDKTGLGAEIAELAQLIELKKMQTVLEYNRILCYANSIEDSLMRQIVTLRHIDGLSWVQVAHSIGGGNTAGGVRKMHERFLTGL